MTTDIILMNRLFTDDTEDGKDKWYSTHIKNCEYKAEVQKLEIKENSNGTQKVFTFLIPFGNFRNYENWKTDQKGYTISINDKIAIGTTNIDTLNTLKVQSFIIAEQKYGVKYQLQIKAVG